MLIIGAGTGNDVAVALDEGAKRVDAVEIDPVLQQLGQERHPERPYADPRVIAHVDDGRAFLERTNRRYDLILLALPDSATIVTGQAALRLENYLFTTEALAQARSLLKPGGTFAMYNYYEHWLVDRYANTIQAVYGAPPCVHVGRSIGARQEAVLSLRADGSAGGCTTTWRPSTSRRCSRPPTTGPFPYLADRTIPRFYLEMLGLILVASLLLVRVTAGPLRQMRPYLDLFFMGARVPAAGDEERGAVRAAVRHHLGGQRRGLRRRAARRCWPRSRPRGGSGCRGRCCSTSGCSPRWCWPG